jgi:hypothetical protein
MADKPCKCVLFDDIGVFFVDLRFSRYRPERDNDKVLIFAA